MQLNVEPHQLGEIEIYNMSGFSQHQIDLFQNEDWKWVQNHQQEILEKLGSFNIKIGSGSTLYLSTQHTWICLRCLEKIKNIPQMMV